MTLEIIKEKYNTYLPSNTLRKRFIIGSFWSLVSSILPNILGLLGSVFVARYLGKIKFGELGIIRSTMETFAIYAGIGFGVTATKYVAEFRNLNKEKSGRIIGMTSIVGLISSIIMALLIFIFSPYISTHVINAPRLQNEFQIACLFLFITGLNGVQNGIISGFEAFKDLAKVSIYGGIFNFIVTIAFVYLGGLTGAVWSLVITRVFQWIINHIALKRILKRENIVALYSSFKEELPLIWKFTIPAVIAASITGPILLLANTILVNQPNGYAEMGVFSAANQWRNYLMLFPSVIGQVVVPILSERFGSRDLSSVKKTIKASVIVNGLATIPIAAIISLWSKNVMNIYGNDFRSGWLVLITVLLFTILLAIQTPVGQILTAQGKMWVGLFMNAGWGIIFLAAYFFLKSFGAFGLSLALLIAYFFHLLWTYLYAHFTLFKNNN